MSSTAPLEGTPAPAPTSSGEPDDAVGGALARLTTGAAAFAVVAALLATVVGLLFTGAAAASVLQDPGALVRWGLPVARLTHDLSAAVALGAMALAATAVRPGTAGWTATARLGRIAAVVWALAAVSVLVLGGADFAGIAPSDPSFGDALSQYAFQLPVGRNVMICALMTAAAATLAVAVRSPVGAGVTVLAGAAALVPLALTGHAANTEYHEVTGTSWWMHMVGVTVWVGGLVTLALLSRRLSPQLVPLSQRYSVVAGWAFALVAFSGIVNGLVRVGSVDGLATQYGALVLVKSALLVALGLAGWWHRRHDAAEDQWASRSSGVLAAARSRAGADGPGRRCRSCVVAHRDSRPR